MASRLFSTLYKGTMDFIMPSDHSTDEHSVQASETGAASMGAQTQRKPEATRHEDADTSSSRTVTGKRGIEEGERRIKHKMSLKTTEGRGSSRTFSGRASPSYLKDHSRKKKAAEQESAKELARDIDALREQLRLSQQELLEANLKSTSADKKIRALEGENRTLADWYKAAEETHADQLKVAQARLADLEAKNRKQEAELRGVREKLTAADEKNHSLGKLLEERTADFKGTQTFMTAADSYSGAEIIGMVDTLNAEIFQIAAFTAELVETDTLFASSQEREDNIKTFRDNLESTERRIGRELASHLLNRYTEVRSDPLPLQLAIQTLLSYDCTVETRTFRYDHFGASLDQLYRKIKTAEASAVAGRWRAITSSKLRANHDYSRVNITLNMIVGLLCVCGMSISNLQSKQQILTLQKMLYTLEKLQAQLKMAVMEGITTADMEVFYIQSGSHLSASMEDIYAEPPGKTSRQNLTATATRAAEARVLCTVGLGLRKSVMKTLHNGESKDQIDTLLKPKVVLSSVLRDVGTGEESRDHGQDGK